MVKILNCCFQEKNESSSSSLSHDNMPKGEEKGGEKWMTDQPTNTVLLRGLPTSVDEKDVSNLTEMYGRQKERNMT